MKTMYFVAVILTVAAVSAGSRPRAPPTNVTDIVTLYQGKVATSLRSTPQYYKAYLCDMAAWAQFTSVTVDLIIPENPDCTTFTGKGCVLAEVFDKDPIKNPREEPISVSYFRDPHTGITGMSRMVFAKSKLAKNSYLWVRAFNPQGSPDLTAELRISGSKMTPTNGRYEAGIFPSPQTNTQVYEFEQFTRLSDADGNVKNGESTFLGIQFCLDQQNPAKEMSISVMATDEYSAFDTYVCTDLTRTYNDACKPLGSALLCNTEGECYDNGGRPYNRVDVSESSVKRTSGHLVLRVVGLGGNKDLNNKYTLYATLAV